MQKTTDKGNAKIFTNPDDIMGITNISLGGMLHGSRKDGRSD